MRESAGQAGREPQDRAKRRGRSLSSLESRLKRSRRLPNASREGAFAKAASWSALIRTIVADEPDPARQDSVIERLMRKLADDHLKHRGAVAPSIGRLSPGSGIGTGAGSTDTPPTAPVGAVPASRAVRSEAVEATPERAASPLIDANRTASGPARAVVLARTGPASSSRDGDGDGRTPDGSGRQGGSDGAVALPPGSVVGSTPERSEARERPAAAQPLRPGRQDAGSHPVVSATAPLEHAASAARPVAPGNGEASADQHGGGKGLRPVPGADVRRRLVIRYALVLAACNAWSDDRKRRLAALAPVDPGRLWSLALDECRTCFGHRAPSTIDRTAASKLLDAVLREADTVGFGALAELRQAFLREKRRGRKGRSRRDMMTPASCETAAHRPRRVPADDAAARSMVRASRLTPTRARTPA